MDASSSDPADRNSGADNNVPGDSNKPQKVDKGKNRRSDSEERRAAEEAEDAELAQRMAEREAGVEEAREEWAVALRRRIERHEEDLRELRAREAAMHSSRGIRAPAPAPAVVPPATSGAGPTKRGRGRPPNPNKTPRVVPPKIKTPRAPRKLKSVEPERTPSRGAEDEDEENDENDSDKEMTGDSIQDLEAHCRELEDHIEVLNQRFGVTYWALVDVLKNFDNENAEARKKLFNGILKTLAQNRRETPIGPESESESSADTHVKVWRKSVAGAETPEENEYIDMEMEDAAGKIGPEKVAEKTPAIHENVESAQETEPITEQVPSIERTAGEITEVGVSAEEIADTLPNAEETAEQAPTVEENAERAPSVVQIAQASIPEVTPKVEESPVQIADGPSGIAAGPGQMWVLMPAPDRVIKAEEDRVFLRAPVHVPTDGPGNRVNDPIILDSDDDDEMEVDPPAAEGGKDVGGAK
ncbi:hypothetical protein GGX14DRAFT_579271 [Mycena pura]|uniref:Uncharacterized protein n=1 Tax=Mycena pura TaxID=153505 RepID=A0AAD6UMX4_9AGAR|nr:hypothetical protein GGX14DRAFT_579271 [Mycena pura]